MNPLYTFFDVVALLAQSPVIWVPGVVALLLIVVWFCAMRWYE